MHHKPAPPYRIASPLAAIALLLLCGPAALAQTQKQDPRDIPPAPAPVTSPADTGMQPNPNLMVKAGELSDFERRFLDTAAQAGAAEIDASRLILERSQDADVKNFAQMMVSDHGDADQQLKQLATAKSVNLPQGAAPEDAKALEKLRLLSGRALDREYSERFGLQAHRQAVAIFERAANEGRDEDVKKFAASVLPTLRRHLHMAEDLIKGSNPDVPPALSRPSPNMPAAPMMQR